MSNTTNCTCEFHNHQYSSDYRIVNFVLIIILLPLLSLFGVLSNFMNLLVLKRKRQLSGVRKSSTLYLAALAASDLLINLTGMTMFSLDSAKGYSGFLRRYLSPVLVTILPIGNTATTCSIYFTIAAAVDCYIAERRGRLLTSWCTTKRARSVIIGIILMAVSYNFVKIWELRVVLCHDPSRNEIKREICQTEFGQTYFSAKIHNVYLHLILMIVAPFCLLACLNHIIIRTIQKRKRFAGVMSLITVGAYLTAKDTTPSPSPTVPRTTPTLLRHASHNSCSRSPSPSPSPTVQRTTPTLLRHPSYNSCSRSPSNTSKSFMKSPSSASKCFMKEEFENMHATVRSYADDDSSTVTLIMVVVLFLLCNLLGVVINIVETFTHMPMLVVNYLADISNVMVIFNASANFLIYINFDSTYRALFMSQLRVKARVKCSANGINDFTEPIYV